MNDAGAWPAPAMTEGRLVLSCAGCRFALPLDAVEAIAPPPLLGGVPHAGAALLGAGNLAGRIVPIIDLARLIDARRPPRRYDGGGEVVRVQAGGGRLGLWVDRVERFGPAEPQPDGDGAGVQPLDPVRLAESALRPPALAHREWRPLGNVADCAAPAAPAVLPDAAIVVEAGGEPVACPREDVAELIERVPWTPLPRSPAGLLGVGVLRRVPVPVISLAALLGREQAVPGAFVGIEWHGRRALFAVDRLVGLRVGAAAGGGGDGAIPMVDLGAILPDELRHIVLGFPPPGGTGERPPNGAALSAATHLGFVLDGQNLAVPIAAVDRVIEPQPLLRLPRPAGTEAQRASANLDGAIAISGSVVPVAALRSALAGPGTPGGQGAAAASAAYVILRSPDGPAALGVDHITGFVDLPDAAVMPAPGDGGGPIAGVARGPDGELVRIVKPERLWSEA